MTRTVMIMSLVWLFRDLLIVIFLFHDFKKQFVYSADSHWFQHVTFKTVFEQTVVWSCVFTRSFLFSPKDLVTKSREALLVELHSKPNVDRRMLLLQEILKREGEHFQTQDGTVSDMIDQLYQQAAYDKKWSAVRRGAGLLKKLVDSLAPGITTLLVSGKVVRCYDCACSLF